MGIKKIQLFIIAILLLSTTSCGVKTIIKKADKRYGYGEYYGAGNIYRRAYRKISTKDRELRGEVAFKMANCYRLTNQILRARNSYANAIRYKINNDTAYLYAAELFRKEGKLPDALKNYTLFAEKHPDDQWAKNGILSCQMMKEWSKEKSRYEVRKADNLNTKKYAEFSPAFANKEGDVLYFNSSRENPNMQGKPSQVTGLRNNDFFLTRKNSQGVWEEPTPLEGDLNTIYDEGAASFSSDGKTMYFTRCLTSGANAAIYKSIRAGAQWSAGEKLNILKDSMLMAAHPAISPDGNYLYFVSDMKGGFGGKDIWRVSLMDNGQWGALENLGADINTESDEMFPYMRSNGELYFSSEAHPGFGGLDIFKATPNGEEHWIVENMKEPINSAGDDFGISFAGDEEEGFFSSNRKEIKAYDRLWAFSAKKIEYILQGRVTDTKGQALGEAMVRVVGDDGTNARVRVQKDGTYKYELKVGVEYVLLASDRGFLNVKKEASTVGLKDGKNFDVNFQLASVSKPVQMDNIFYEFGKWTLTPESEAGIKDLANLLKDNPNVTMEIGAHTDMVGTDQANNELSRKRAQEVVNYLIREGIESDRLTAVGYGETVPVTVTQEMAQQHTFLKEGDVLNEAFITSKPANEQEIMNQINRRTEFKVLKTTYKMY